MKSVVLSKQPREKWSRESFAKEARVILGDGACELCGVLGGWHAHHRNRDWKDNAISNLQRLCKNCHARQHTGPRPQTPNRYELGPIGEDGVKLTLIEAAKAAGVHPNTIRNWRRSGLLLPVCGVTPRTWRWDRHQVLVAAGKERKS